MRIGKPYSPSPPGLPPSQGYQEMRTPGPGAGRGHLDPEMGDAQSPPGSWRGSPPLSIRLGNPAWVFALLADVVAPLRPLRFLILPSCVLAGYGAVFNLHALEAHMSLVALKLSFWQSLVFTMFTANLLGKVAQGLAMARHHADTNELGIRLAFGVLPKFYILKGPITELGFAAQRHCYAAPLVFRLWLLVLGILTWMILRQTGSGLADVGLALAAAGLSSLLFTANPLLPADGYRWLTAWLERPRLRQDGLKILRLLLTFRRMPDELSSREFWLLLLYAVVSVAFTAFVFLSIILAVAFVLELQLRGTGVILFCVMMAGFVAFLLSFVDKRRTGRARRAGRRGSGRQQADGAPVR